MAEARNSLNYLNYAHISFLLFQQDTNFPMVAKLLAHKFDLSAWSSFGIWKLSSKLLSNLAKGCDHLKPFVKWFPNSRNSRWSRHHQSWGRTQGQNQNRPLLGKIWQIFSHIMTMWPLSKSYFQQNNDSVVNWTLSGRDQDYVVTPVPPSKSAWNAINRGGCVQLC